MRRYDLRIVNELLDRYERRRGNRAVWYRIDEKHLPEYFDASAFAYRQLHEQLEALEAKGLVALVWKNGRRGHILEKVRLEEDRISDCYAFAGRRPAGEKAAAILSVCEDYAGDGGMPVLTAFLEWIRSRLAEGSSIRQFADPDEPEELERLCRMIQAMETNTEEQYLRQFSVRVFRDSKIAESLAEKAASVVRRFGPPALAEGSSDAVLEEYSIYRNPSWIYCKGWGRLCLRESRDAGVDLSLLQDGIGFTARDAALLRWDAGQAPDAVMTIENLTAFHQQDPMEGCPSDHTLLVYIGGFAGRAKRAFLSKLGQAFPRAAFYHFGDIDCGGFLIWRSLREGTDLAIRTWRMDLATWEEYRSLGRPLTAHDRRQMEKMLEDPYFCEQRDLFRRMLEDGVKLEQESVISRLPEKRNKTH